MTTKSKSLLACMLLAACTGSAPPPAPALEPSTVQTGVAGEDTQIGSLRVSASTLNVRSDPSATAEVVSHARRGERLALLKDSGEWLRVRMPDGTVGWVSSQHVTREGAGARPRRGCLPDSDFNFVKTPTPSIPENGTAHGMVTVEANVDVKGLVISTRVVSNSTGDEALATLTQHEIRDARFSPPIRNCVPRAFIYTYKRSF